MSNEAIRNLLKQLHSIQIIKPQLLVIVRAGINPCAIQCWKPLSSIARNVCNRFHQWIGRDLAEN